MALDGYRFNIGAFDCIAINDYTSTYAASRFFTNAAPDQVAQALRQHGLEADLPASYTCLFVDTGSHKVLIDTGMGAGIHPQRGPYVGKLLQVLQAEGVDAKDVDTVVLTHGHGDHIGGSVDGSGEPVFANARHVMWADEWFFWKGEADLSSVSMPDGLKQMLTDTAREKLGALERRMDLIDSEGEIVPGVFAIEAKGHTPGHMAVAISSGDEQLLYISDTVLHPLHLEYPDWQTDFYDFDAAEAASSKRRLFDQAAAEGALALTFHFYPFPSLGHVVREGEGWRWQPLG